MSPLSISTILLISFGFLVPDSILKRLDRSASVTFVGDDILAGIIPNISESWASIKTGISSLEPNKTDTKAQLLWDDVLQKMKPVHIAIRAVDRLVLENSPSFTLNPIVNISLEQLKNLTERAEKHDNTLEWLDSVKESWIRISSLASQIHWKYNWVFDHVFADGVTPHSSKANLHDTLNESLQLYHVWYRVPDRGTGDGEPGQQWILDMKELSDFSKNVASGEGAQKNMFHGLRDLLGRGAKPVAENSANPCLSNETFAGKRGDAVNKVIPIYVLLHLLSSEFKYFLMRNIADMYTCVHRRECRFETSDITKEHLTSYYQFYYSGIVEAFGDNSEEDEPASKLPESAWRWRCDPPLITEPNKHKQPQRRDHKENVTFARLYFTTTFMDDISLTQTCQKTCDMYDSAYSSINCKGENWNSLEQEKGFENIEEELACPVQASTICLNDDNSCYKTPFMKANVCKAQKSKRRVEWIKSDAVKTMGKKAKCDMKEMESLVIKELQERSISIKYDPQRCEICLCKCHEPVAEDSHQFISLAPQVADSANGYTMVGVKFAKVGRIIHVLIAEAKIMNGKVDATTIRWKKLNTANKSDNTQVFRVGKRANRILLDDFIAPAGHVVTGIKLTSRQISRPEDYQSGSILKAHNVYLLKPIDAPNLHHGLEDKELAFEVQITPLGKDGILKTEESKWTSNRNNSDSRKEVKLKNPNEPTLSAPASIPASSPNQFIVIQRSSLIKNTRQTQVPFFDTQELLEKENIAPIRAIGLFYKGLPGHGGFLAFRQVSVPRNDVSTPPGFDLWSSLPSKKNRKE